MADDNPISATSIILDSLARIENNMLTKTEFHAYQGANEQRFNATDKTMDALAVRLDARIDGAVQNAKADVDELATSFAKQEERTRSNKFQAWLGVGLALLAVAGGVIQAWVTFSIIH